tara:strand:+ start:307 stop:648 length:342 start_codon:yes stop_codon:yes gene_type:complete
MTNLNQSYIYLSIICRNVECLRNAEKELRKLNPKLLSMDSEGEVTQHSFTINDVNLLQSIEDIMNRIHCQYPKFRYFMTVENDIGQGQYRVYINKKGKKVVTKNATKRIGFYF